MDFEWDDQKREANINKHGVDFVAGAMVLMGEHLVAEDTRKDYGEPRFLAYGTSAGRLLAVVFTIRGEAIRIISVRKANKREVAEYERKIQS